MERTRRLAVMLDADTLAVIDAEVRRRRMDDGGRHSRASVIRAAVNDLVQRWSDEERITGGEGKEGTAT